MSGGRDGRGRVANSSGNVFAGNDESVTDPAGETWPTEANTLRMTNRHFASQTQLGHKVENTFVLHFSYVDIS